MKRILLISAGIGLALSGCASTKAVPSGALRNPAQAPAGGEIGDRGEHTQAKCEFQLSMFTNSDIDLRSGENLQSVWVGDVEVVPYSKKSTGGNTDYTSAEFALMTDQLCKDLEEGKVVVNSKVRSTYSYLTPFSRKVLTFKSKPEVLTEINGFEDWAESQKTKPSRPKN